MPDLIRRYPRTRILDLDRREAASRVLAKKILFLRCGTAERMVAVNGVSGNSKVSSIGINDVNRVKKEIEERLKNIVRVGKDVKVICRAFDLKSDVINVNLRPDEGLDTIEGAGKREGLRAMSVGPGSFKEVFGHFRTTNCLFLNDGKVTSGFWRE